MYILSVRYAKTEDGHKLGFCIGTDTYLKTNKSTVNNLSIKRPCYYD